jgi:CheY-like chemotaxis protein
MLDRHSVSPSVLVVEDEALVRIFAVDHLEELGFEVAEAASAADALDKVQRLGSKIRAAVVDMGLPDRKGDVLVAELRAIVSDLPIIVASGQSETMLRERLQADPFLRFLGKPYDGTQLEAALQSLNVGCPRAVGGSP